ncbi:NAD(P)-binding protein [Lichtheimia hyalospora FSU 10163]|nr:NAD(P)-binding protein [Lichtheimia hyalospora FSU 10163]
MTKSLDGKVAVLTGASRNIGKAVAVELVRLGAKVVIGDVLDAQGQETVRELNESAGDKVAVYLHVDVSKYDDNIALFRLAENEFGGVDIAFLNAGIGTNANTMFLPLDDQVDDRMLGVNTMGVIKGTKVAMLHMAKRGGGVIISTASMAGLVCLPAMSIYNASKHGVVGWTRSCGIYKHVCNVRVNAICPTWIKTELSEDLANKKNDDPCNIINEASPFATKEDVVKAFMTLLEDEERSGQTLMVLSDHVIEPAEPPTYGSLKSTKSTQVYQQYFQEAIVSYKKQLAEARERYGI